MRLKDTTAIGSDETLFVRRGNEATELMRDIIDHTSKPSAPLEVEGSPRRFGTGSMR